MKLQVALLVISCLVFLFLDTASCNVLKKEEDKLAKKVGKMDKKDCKKKPGLEIKDMKKEKPIPGLPKDLMNML